LKYLSTRKLQKPTSLSQALVSGLAEDGGLFVPEKIPHLNWKDFQGQSEFYELAHNVLLPFFSEDPLQGELSAICKAAFNFPVPLKYLKKETGLLELFHGPTSAFKDFGARFLAECLSRLEDQSKRCILVATSGDTGGAVASAFYQRANMEVGILFPKGFVTERQEKQLTCWGENIKSFAVEGNFDDCQQLVKSAFKDEAWRQSLNLTSANSINIGRLLPQIVYYAAASIWYMNSQNQKPSFIIPTGNLGNAMAAFYAKEMGFPINKIALSTNSNRVVVDYIFTGEWKETKAQATLANAMDVGNPSNLERLDFLFADHNHLKEIAVAIPVSDEQIKVTISRGLADWGEVWCPHTATAVYFRERLQSSHWIIVSTAHPAKFENIVEKLIGKKVEVPNNLKHILAKESSMFTIKNDLEAFKKFW